MSPFWKKVAAAAFLIFLALWVVAMTGGFALPLPRALADPAAFSAVQTRAEQRPPHPDEQTGDYTPQPAVARETAVGVRTGRLRGEADTAVPGSARPCSAKGTDRHRFLQRSEPSASSGRASSHCLRQSSASSTR